MVVRGDRRPWLCNEAYQGVTKRFPVKTGTDKNGNDKTGKTLIRPAVVGCDCVGEEVSSRISNCKKMYFSGLVHRPTLPASIV